MNAYGASYRTSSAFTGRAPRSIEARWPTSNAISGPVWASWWMRIIIVIAGH